MSRKIELPILQENSPDREINCEVALEPAFEELAAASQARGWTAQETAATLLRIAKAHADRLEVIVDTDGFWRRASSISLDAAAEVFRDAMRQTVKRYSLWYLVEGVLLVAAGILAVIFPMISSVAVVVLLGWLLIISGALQGISLVGAGHVPHFWLQLISVILAVMIGLLFLRHPGNGLLTITLLLIVFFMIEGISKVVFALTIRPFPNWGWVLGSGLIGILLSLILWIRIPLTAVWLIGLLLGIELISVGAATAYLAWQVRKS
ncbi:HdeD family acid-resistance protein [Mesorhizobium calcicola]|uniref:HdeD family acid-resistance protein n=1 Tax=Mesorhizobium calcicola TaxID=1300310 RepID=A0ABW4WGW3_9HYPH